MESQLEDFQVEHKNPSMRWRRAVVILNNPGLRFRHIAYLAKQKEAERKKQIINRLKSSGRFILALICLFLIKAIHLCWSHVNRWLRSFQKESLELATRSEEEESEIQSYNGSPAASLEIFYSFETDWSETDIALNFPSINVRQGTKTEVWKIRILLANFIVELMSIVFDQLSSLHKHKACFLLLCLIMSMLAVLISILELVYKLKKERVFSKGVTNWRSWLSDPPPGVRVGFFLCIIALTCAFGQCIITTVNYSLYRKHGNAPIKISIWSTIFAFGQLVSSLISRGAKTEIIDD